MYKKGDICPICGMGNLDEKAIQKSFEYKNKKHSIQNYHTFVCDGCNESFASKRTRRKIEKELTDFRRNVDGLLLSHEIKEIRLKLQRTQVDMAQLLGVAPKTFARYENGQVTQSKLMDNLLRVLNRAPHMINVFEQVKPVDEIHYEIKEHINQEVDIYKEENDEPIEYGDLSYAKAA